MAEQTQKEKKKEDRDWIFIIGIIVAIIGIVFPQTNLVYIGGLICGFALVISLIYKPFFKGTLLKK